MDWQSIEWLRLRSVNPARKNPKTMLAESEETQSLRQSDRSNPTSEFQARSKSQNLDQKTCISDKFQMHAVYEFLSHQTQRCLLSIKVQQFWEISL